MITDWKLQKSQLRKLKAQMLLLEQSDRDMAVGSLIFKLPLSKIYYAKISGRVALRPRLCIGPDGNTHVTFLERVKKKDNEEKPSLDASKAPQRMQELVDGSTTAKRITIHMDREANSNG